jgi:hypothetical protein
MRGWRKTTAADADNPVISDLHLVGGDAEILGDGDELEATAQEVRSRLLLFRGSFFGNLREGVPWYQEILVKGPNVPRIREILRQAILTHPAIVDVLSLVITTDRATRAATVTWSARTVDGRIVRSEEHGPVIVGGAEESSG